MTKAFTISIIFVLAVSAVSLVYRATIEPSVESADASVSSLGDGMGSALQVPRDASDFEELMKLIDATLDADEWTVVGSPTRIVHSNELIETETTNADYVLTLGLFRGTTLLATQTRYLANHRGPDMEMEQVFPEHLECAMYSNGFLSGSCKIQGESDKQVAVNLDWVFDDKRAGLKSNFKCNFDVTVEESGVVDCENHAKLHWNLDRKATEQSDEPKSR